MNAMRMGLFCALVGWMAADAQAQLGTYGSPDPIPLGQYAPRDFYAPATISRTSYATVADGPGPTLIAAPAGNVPQPPLAVPGAIPQVPSESSAVSSMLNEPGPTVNAPTGCNVMSPGGYIKNPGNCDASGDVCGGNSCCGGCCSPWYVTLNALCMTRNRPNTVYTSYEASNPNNQGSFSDVNWTWGGQGTVGYRFGCCCEWAVEGTYWGLAESSSDGAPNCRGPYSTPMTFGLTDVLGTTGGTGAGNSQQASSWTDNSPDHHIWRDYQAQNVEINFLRSAWSGECNRVGLDFLAGIRWFRFQDGFVFGAKRMDQSTPFFVDQYANDWLYLNDHITNDLIGAQMGFNASYRFADCWKVFLRPEFGIYDNHMTMDYNVYAVGNNPPAQYQASSQTYPNQNYPVHATSDGFAFLTQVDLGLDWQITGHVATQLGYRVLAVTGMGLSDSQIPSFGNDTQAIADIRHNDSLILHGAFAGLTFSW